MQTIKYSVKKLTTTIVNNDFIWPLLKPVLQASLFAFYSRKNPNSVSNKYAHLLDGKVVLNGPFQGMKYPNLEAFGSCIYPKILGSYERELHDTLNSISKNQYSEIIDVGCAEGYYAVGLSVQHPEAKVYAYDIDETARRLCAEMAQLNKVDSRVEVKSFCSAEELENFKFTTRGLVICDCEGFEKQLFNQGNIQNLTNCDVLIEVHDFIDIETSGYLKALFEKTHHITLIKSTDDYEKARTYQYNETESASLDDKLNLFREWRPFIMDWMVCTPK